MNLRNATWVRCHLREDGVTLSVSFGRRTFERLHSIRGQVSADGVRIEIVLGVPRLSDAMRTGAYTAQGVVEYADVVFAQSIVGMPILRA